MVSKVVQDTSRTLIEAYLVHTSTGIEPKMPVYYRSRSRASQDYTKRMSMDALKSSSTKWYFSYFEQTSIFFSSQSMSRTLPSSNVTSWTFPLNNQLRSDLNTQCSKKWSATCAPCALFSSKDNICSNSWLNSKKEEVTFFALDKPWNANVTIEFLFMYIFLNFIVSPGLRAQDMVTCACEEWVTLIPKYPGL